MNEPELKTFHEWTFRWQPARKEPSRLLLLLHGFTGDENSMWMLVRNMPEDYAILAPRGLYRAREGGYTWRSGQRLQGQFPNDHDLIPSARAVVKFIDEWSGSAGLAKQPVDLIGFSQGAALVYVLGLLYPERAGKLAPLSGFIPAGSELAGKGAGLAGKKVFVAHGRQDEMVPVEMARLGVEKLKEWGAQVTYCESDAGHKVSRECLLAMEDFFKG